MSNLDTNSGMADKNITPVEEELTEQVWFIFYRRFLEIFSKKN